MPYLLQAELTDSELAFGEAVRTNFSFHIALAYIDIFDVEKKPFQLKHVKTVFLSILHVYTCICVIAGSLI